MMRKKRICESAVTLSQVMMPMDANHYGNVHGGAILKMVDEAAFVAATKHARQNVVLVSMDHIEFKHTVNIGDMLNISASVLHVGKSSMDIEVNIQAEKIKEGKRINIGSAYLTMVALGKNGKPVSVPGLILETVEQRIKNEQIQKRRQKRISDLLSFATACPQIKN